MTAIDSIIYKINGTSCWIVIFTFMLILVSVIYVYRLFFLTTQKSGSTTNTNPSGQDQDQDQDQEGFTINKEFTYKSGEKSYDNFYAKMYDNLFYSNLVDDYEVGIILNKASPVRETDVLVIGSKTGKHVDTFTKKGYNAYGIDESKDLMLYAMNKYPDSNYVLGNSMNQLIFNPEKFTLITLLDFAVYTIPDRRILFENCYKWLIPGGFLAIHLINVGGFYDSQVYGARERRFSPTISRLFDKKPVNNPLGNNDAIVDDIIYRSDMKMSDPSAIEMRETFKNRKNGKRRQNVQMFNAPDQSIILSEAKDCGFNMLAQNDLLPYKKPFQYIYILYKPAN
jgi:SAM-dependent methyltransferase